MIYSKNIKMPQSGGKITYNDQGARIVPDQLIVPFISGDGIGVDISPVMQKVVNAALKKTYQGEKVIHWLEIYAGEKACQVYGPDQWLPDETLAILDDYKVGIKGPLTTPVGGGIRSLNVALRQQLELFACIRPIRYFKGSPSPLKEPWRTNVVIFRENSEGIYAGIEWEAGTDSANQLIGYLQNEMNVKHIRYPENCGIGVKITSEIASKRLIRKAIEYAIAHDRDKVTLVHKGNIMKYTEGAFCKWGYELAREVYNAQPYEGGPWHSIVNPRTGKTIMINDVIADAFLQQVILRPDDFDVIATMNLNGDYFSDALAAHVGGIGIAPGANIGVQTGLFEATHGTAPSYAGLNKVNPNSLILSAVMMLDYLGWTEAGQCIESAIKETILNQEVTYDFARQMQGVSPLSTSEYGDRIIHYIQHA